MNLQVNTRWTFVVDALCDSRHTYKRCIALCDSDLAGMSWTKYSPVSIHTMFILSYLSLAYIYMIS